MTAVTHEMKSYAVVDAIIDIFASWLKHRREVDESCNCDSDEFSRIAHDLGVTPGELQSLVRKGPHAHDELPKMLQALGIDQSALAKTQPLVLRDMERTCAQCDHKRQCDQDLAAGKATEHYEEYCGNALTIDALRGKPN